jgi:hypothetical protein
VEGRGKDDRKQTECIGPVATKYFRIKKKRKKAMRKDIG